MSPTQEEAPILVVGGRTTGIMMAIELARRGLPVRIIDKSPGIDPHSRATLLHSRTLEIMHALGLASELMDGAQQLHRAQFYVNGIHRATSIEVDVDSPYPSSVALAQPKTERVLERYLNRLGVDIERNTELTGLTQSADCVDATICLPDGCEQTMKADWVIGCDGAHSTVRHLVANQFPGEADPYPYLIADCVVSGPINPEDAYFFFSDHGDLFFFVLDEGRRLVVANLAKGNDVSVQPTLEQIQEVVTTRGTGEFQLSDPRWLSHFHIQYRLAPHYRTGRVFLAGDAAHVHSLIGGHGLNSGIQDAYNLAWKLGLVASGVVPTNWLDSYEIERRSVAEDVIATTKRATENSELFADRTQGDRERLVDHMLLPESLKVQAKRHGEELDLDYRRSPICIDVSNGFAAGPHPGAQAPDATPLIVAGATCSLYDLRRGTNHLVLLFADHDPTVAEGDYAGQISNILTTIDSRHGHWLDLVVVAPADFISPSMSGLFHVEDPQGRLRAKYGVENEALYLIRPDGYVGFRSREIGSLQDYLDQVL